jgi:hypothetical protein
MCAIGGPSNFRGPTKFDSNHIAASMRAVQDHSWPRSVGG